MAAGMPSAQAVVAIAAVDAVAEGGMLAAEAGDVEVLLCKVQGQFYAIANRCTHGLARLDEGQLQGHILSCPLHQGKFDIRNGRCVQAPPVRPLATYVVRIEGKQVGIVAPAKAAPTASFKFGPLG